MSTRSVWWALVLVVVGCSSSSSSPAPATTTEPAAPAKEAGHVDPPPVAPPAAALDAGDDGAKPGECSSSADQTSCVSCCANAHVDGATTYYGTVMMCMCVTDKCQKDCESTFCNEDKPAAPNATCNSCISSFQTSCATDIETACNADPDCVAFDQCIAQSDCLGKH
jgi:hypothetical protein